VEVDYPGELARLREGGLHPPAVTAEQAMAAALHSRPDVLSRRAEVRDAARDVDLAANDFLPALGLELGVNAPGTPKRDVWAIRTDRTTRSAGVSFDYDLDQTDHRDAYRNAMLAHEQALRDYEEFADSVRLDVLKDLRELDRAQAVHQIQEQSLAVARRRQTLAQLEQSKGQASARDVLEAESALVAAQNATTDALVSYLSTRLSFLSSLGLLEAGPDGLIGERTEAVTFERIVERYDYLQP
jgi:outer membrane protein TolC